MESCRPDAFVSLLRLLHKTAEEVHDKPSGNGQFVLGINGSPNNVRVPASAVPSLRSDLANVNVQSAGIDFTHESFGLAVAQMVPLSGFAVTHLEAWHVLGTFVVGLGLGAAMRRWNSLALCIGLHMGLNAAALVAESNDQDARLTANAGNISANVGPFSRSNQSLNSLTD